MSAEERSAADAVYILRAVARLMRVSPHDTNDLEWAEMHATYLEDIAEAVVRDAAIDREQLDQGAKYVGTEWESALAPILFGQDKAHGVYRSIQTFGKRNQ